jgi:hypothetical protein
VMFYDLYGDRRVGASPNWKKTPYVYAASTYAAKLNGGAAPVPDPAIQVTPSSLSFGNVIVDTTKQLSYTITGSYFTTSSGNITITAPIGFTVSKTSGSGYASSVTCAYANNTLSATTIYVRFLPTALQSYDDNITNSGGGASSQSVVVTGTGISATAPMLSISPSLRAFGNVIISTTSAESTYTISGSNLTPLDGNINVLAPSGFQVSSTTGLGFDTSCSVSYSSGNLSPRSIYVRFSPTVVGDYSDNITNSGGGASIQYVAVTGTGIAPTARVLTVSPSSRAFGNVTVNTTSAESTYTISGSNLTPINGNITITSSSGQRFQISQTSGSNFTSSLTVAYTGGTISSKTIYVRFRPIAAQNYNATIRNVGGGATTQNVTVSGTGASPLLTVNPTSLPFGGVVINDTSNERIYTLSGSNLSPVSGNIIVTAPSTAYQVSLTTGSGFGSSINVPYTGGAIFSPDTIFVRFLPTVVQSESGNITNSGGGATAKNVSVSGIGIAASAPVITTNPTSLWFDDVTRNTISPEKTYILSGSNLSPQSGDVNIVAPVGFQVSSIAGSGFDTSITISYTSGTLSPRTIYARFLPTLLQTYSGNITNTGGGATSQDVTVSGTGISAAVPILTVSPSSITFGNIIVGTTSAESTYTISGSSLIPANGNITINAPEGYQVSSTAGFGFDSLFVSYSSGILSSRTIYVRFSPIHAGYYNGIITNSGGGATTPNIAVSGIGLPSDEIVQLGQSFPNPFNPYTKIPYSLYKKARVKLSIFNMLGQRISTLIDKEQDVGYYQPEFNIYRTDNGIELTSGVYFYRLEIAGILFTKKLILIK